METLSEMHDERLFGKNLLKNNSLKKLFLKESLRKLGFDEKVLKKNVSDEVIIWDTQGNILCIPNTRRELKKYHDEKFISLKDVKKINYRPFFSPLVIGGVASGSMENDAIYFYRALHADTKAFLSVNNLWLAIPEFQKLLQEFITVGSLTGSLQFDLTTGSFIPRKRRNWKFFLDNDLFVDRNEKPVREKIGGLYASMEWEENEKQWKIVKNQ